MKALFNQRDAHLLIWSVKQEDQIIKVISKEELETGDVILPNDPNFLAQYEITEVIESKPNAWNKFPVHTIARAKRVVKFKWEDKTIKSKDSYGKPVSSIIRQRVAM